MIEYIRRLPYILSALITIIVGLISYISNVGSQIIYYRMAASMVAFYLLGLYARRSLMRLYEEVSEEKDVEEKETLIESQKQDQVEKTSTIDVKIDNQEDDFLPLEMSKAVRTVTLKDDLK
jgi:hypothetical protein